MVRHASLFSQVVSLVNRHHFASCVKELEAEKHAKGILDSSAQNVQLKTPLISALAPEGQTQEACDPLGNISRHWFS